MSILRITAAAVAALAAAAAGPALAADAAPSLAAVKPMTACPQPTVVWDTSKSAAVNIRFSNTPVFHDGPGGTMKVTKTYSGTAKWSGTISAEADLGSIVASAKASISTTIESSNTTTATNELDHPITSGKYGNAEYDSSGYKVNWKKYQQNHDCSLTLLDSGTVNLPTTKEGWRYWETSN